MKIQKEILLNDLIRRTENNVQQAQKFKNLTDGQLNWRQSKNSWSILECIEHLNLYGDFYIPEIVKSIKNSTYQPSNIFKSGLLGNKFANSVLPSTNSKKVKTFKDKNPIYSDLNKSTIEKFINQQSQLLEILNNLKDINLTKTKTAISISKWIKLRLGDTLRVVIYHNDRHIQQAHRVRHNVNHGN